MEVIINRIYEYKQHQYQVTDLIRQKTPGAHGEGSWVDAVEYQRIGEDEEKPSGMKFSREKTDFAEKFLPISLWKNDEIIAISMGKVIGVFKVDIVDEDAQIVHFSNSEWKMTASRCLAPISGEVKIHGEVDAQFVHAQFFYLSPRYDRILSLKKNIDHVLIRLNDCRDSIIKHSDSLSPTKIERIEGKIDDIINITENKD